MKLMPQPDGRIAIVYTGEEDMVLERLRAELGLQDSRQVATIVYGQLMRASAPDLVEAIARLDPPLT